VTDTDMIGNTFSAITIDSGSSVSNAIFTGCTLDGSDINFVVRGAATSVINLSMMNTSLSNSATNHGLHLRDGTIEGLSFDNVTMADNKNQGFFVSNGATLIDASISGGTIDGNEFGVLTRASITNLEVEGVQITNNRGSGLSIGSGTLNGLRVEDCTFDNNAWEHIDIGIGWMGSLTASDVYIAGNAFLTGPWVSVYVAATFGPSDIVVSFNDFVGGGWGVFNTVTSVVDGRWNWWGDASGPSGVGLGTGAAVSANVLFEPWYFLADPEYPVTSYDDVETEQGTGTAMFGSSAGEFVDLQAVPAVSPAPRGVSFPHGMFEFEITGLSLGETITLVIEFPDPIPAGTVWWKHDGSSWYSLPNLRDNGDNVMEIELTDGGLGDSGPEDGTILDPGGPGNPMAPLTVGWEGSSVNKAAVMAPWIALSALIAGASVFALRRRRVQT